jgi:hypothetical protein
MINSMFELMIKLKVFNIAVLNVCTTFKHISHLRIKVFDLITLQVICLKN